MKLSGTLFSLFSFVLALLVVPFFARAVAVDEAVTLVLPSGGSEFTLTSNSSFDTLTVNNTNFEFVMSGGQKATLESADKKIFETSDINKTTSCFDAKSSIIIELDPGDSDGKTITITPSSDTCASTNASTGAGGGASSGGGGGGGGGSSITTTPSPSPETPAEEPTAPSVPSAPSTSAVFGSNLGLGMQSGDVTRLQILLASDSSLYPEGLVTGYFGALTQKAVERFQTAHGVVSGGSPATTGFGHVGPKTRAKLQEVFGGGVSAPETPSLPSTPAAVSSLFTSGLGRGMSNADIKRLQQLLNTDSDTRVAGVGVGSPGNETNFFGALTERAVQKFQMKHGVVVSAADPGYGYVGPKTRAKLQEVFGGTTSVPQGTSAQTPTPSGGETTAADIQAQIDAAQAQINALLEQLQQITQ